MELVQHNPFFVPMGKLRPGRAKRLMEAYTVVGSKARPVARVPAFPACVPGRFVGVWVFSRVPPQI